MLVRVKAERVNGGIPMSFLQKAKRRIAVAGGSRLPAESVDALKKEADMSLEQVMLELIPLASGLAQPPLSNFFVGAVAQGTSGALYFGANLEFAGYALNLTVHAEQAAVVNAIGNSETGLLRLAISAPPCGYCRQFLQELVNVHQLKILLHDAAPAKLAKFLPGAFGPADLGVVGGLLTPQRHSLKWLSRSRPPGDVAERTLNAARASYAPYTKAFAAMGLTTHDGKTFVGPYLENAAFNPSLSPIQSTAVALMLAGRGWKEVATAVLVQIKDSPVDHGTVARSLLRVVAPHVRVKEYLVETDATAGAEPTGRSNEK